MKLNVLKYAIAALPLIGFSACLDFDTPSDEFSDTEKELDPIVYQGDADKLDFSVQPSEEEVDEALAALQDYLGNFISAQYYLAGGKNGAPPQEHQWQYIYSLNTDCYAGYFTLINSSFMAGTIPTTYSYQRDYCEGPYGRFLDMKNYLANFLNIDASNNVVELKAIALLLFDIAAQENTDLYGSIPFVDHKGNKEVNPFEFLPGRDIYASIVQNLDDIDACLSNFSNRPQWYQDKINGVLTGGYDVLTQGKNLETWRRMANSLKLRMAMHVVKAMPDKAKQWAEEAVASGVIDSKIYEAGVFGATGQSVMHPLKVILVDWNDSRLNASFISLLASLNHPWMDYLIAKNTNPIINEATGDVVEANTMIVGVRAGDFMEGSQQYQSNMRYAYSRLNPEHDDFLWMPVYIFKWAETDFLRAEGALRGWNMGGDPETFYNRGILNADCGERHEEYLITGEYDSRVADYMAQTEATPYTYVDPMNYDNNMESLTKIGVKWDNSDDNETKLEKIITQKYIAMFPYSYEAWTEMRRTGYPKIFPVKNPGLADGSLQYGDLIRRMHLPHGDTQAGQEDVNNSGLEAIGGPDLYSTRVFWDTEATNF